MVVTKQAEDIKDLINQKGTTQVKKPQKYVKKPEKPSYSNIKDSIMEDNEEYEEDRYRACILLKQMVKQGKSLLGMINYY